MSQSRLIHEFIGILTGEGFFDKEQIGVKEPFPMTNCQFTS